MQWARVIFCTRIPFAFLDRRTKRNRRKSLGDWPVIFLLQEPPAEAVSASASSSSSAPWPHVMQAAFLDHYLAFLSLLGASRVSIVQDSSPRSGGPPAPSTPLLGTDIKRINPSLQGNAPENGDNRDAQWQHYLHVPVHEGLVVVSLSIHRGLVCVELYALPAPSLNTEGAPSYAPRGRSRVQMAFARECSLLASRLRTAGAVYDFQVEQLQLYLQLVDAPTPPYPSHHFLRVLTTLCQNPPPPAAANTVIMQPVPVVIHPCTSGSSDTGGPSNGESSLELFNFLCKNASRYGLKTLERRGIAPAIFFAPPCGGSIPSPFTHSVLCFASPEIARGTQRNRAYESGDTLPADAAEAPKDPSDIAGPRELPLHMFIVRTRHSEAGAVTPLQEVLRDARAFITAAIVRAQEDLTRDLLWARLVGGEQAGRLTDSEFALLMDLAGWRALEETDAALHALFSPSLPVPWAAVIRHLADIYPRRAVLLSSHTHQHLLLFNPRDHDALLHVMYDTQNNTARIFAALRDGPRAYSRKTHQAKENSPAKLSSAEQEEVTNLVNLVCIFLTRQLLGAIRA